MAERFNNFFWYFISYKKQKNKEDTLNCKTKNTYKMPIIRLTIDEGIQLLDRQRNEIWRQMSTLNLEAKRIIWTEKDAIALINVEMPPKKERKFRKAVKNSSIMFRKRDNEVFKMQAPVLVRGPSDRRGEEEEKEDQRGRKRKRSDGDVRESKKTHL